MFRWVLPVTMLFALLTLLGCGSSGGGGGETVDPIELEVGAALDSFSAALGQRESTQALAWVDSNLTYYRSGLLTPERYSSFATRLETFFQKVQSVSFVINQRGIVSSGENGALVRGDLVYSYIPAGQTTPVERAEKIEMTFQRVSKWGILNLGSQEALTTFPPEL